MADPLQELRNELRSLREEIRRLQDLEEIKQLRSTYFQCVDAQEWERWGHEVLTEDFRFESHGSVTEGRDAVIESVSKSLAGARTVHHGHTPTITFTGPDTATGVWAMNDYVTMPHPTDGSPIVIRGYGHYFDDYVRTASGWRLKSSTLERLRVDVEGASLPGE